MEERVAARTAELATMADSLRLANSEQTAVSDAANVGILVIRSERIVRCNQAMNELMGYARGELGNQPARCLYCEETDYQQNREVLRTLLASRGTYSAEPVFHRKDGECFTARVTFELFETIAEGNGLVCVAENIIRERETIETLAPAARIKPEVLNVIYRKIFHESRCAHLC